MNLQELGRIREQERSTDSLQALREDFYDEVSAYLDDLKTSRDRAAADADDPFADPEVRRISDELTAAERTVEAIYERRVGKIVKLASFAAADMNAEQDGLTNEERELFEAIAREIKANRDRVLGTLAEASSGERDAPVASRSDDGDTRGGKRPNERSPNTSTDQPPDDRQAAKPEHIEEADDRADLDRRQIRITKDVGEIVGVDDRAYHLGIDDIVTLPAENAEPLLRRDAAEPIE